MGTTNEMLKRREQHAGALRGNLPSVINELAGELLEVVFQRIG